MVWYLHHSDKRQYLEERAMKTPIYLLIVVSLILGSCSSSYKAGVAEYDDLYYTPSDVKMQAQVENVQPVANQQNVQAVPQEELSDYENYRLALEDDYLNEDAQASLEIHHAHLDLHYLYSHIYRTVLHLPIC